MVKEHDEVGLLDLGDELAFDPVYVDRFLRPFVTTQVLELLQRVLADERYLSWCAQRSYRHRNAFTKVVLGVSQGGRKLVWHKWDDPGHGDADYHNHRWSFASYVVSGLIELRDFEEHGSEGLMVTRYAYRSPESSSHFGLERNGIAYIRQVRRTEVGAGTYYFQPHPVVHCARPIGDETSTLIVQGEVAAMCTSVYSPGRTREDDSIVIRLDPSELRILLRNFAEVFVDGHAS